MLERLLERISLSQYKDNFILKGGMLISAMLGIDSRTTMDMDTTIKGFPLTEENIKARRKVCKRCDETWIKGFSIMNETMTRRLPFIYKNQKEYDFSEQTACHNTLLKSIYGHSVIEYQIYYCLKCYPEHYKKWLELFPNYKPVYEIFDKMDFEKVKKIVEEQ